ncbi:nuclear transport factor 2 family protein [Streptomyces sp. AJS327]|uniref:nuclear transport factor 2 family protein n=1 Tax=Streptomyces sp. AJS327 TaxID=2545265 RepID=UPI0015DF4A5B|nr:nuclear transport factor 2 family protein [Streptomyces sp. AJS327]QNN81296.1 IonBI [Streptomyces sp.]
MPDETTCKALAVAHCERINAGDVEGLLKLYSPAVRFEDPVGGGERIGHGALRSHIAGAVTGGVHDAYGEPVAAPDGRHAAVPVTSTVNFLPNGPLMVRYGMLDTPEDPENARMEYSCTLVIQVGESELIEDMRVYWGRSDVRFVD